jgi:hypothetical protein
MLQVSLRFINRIYKQMVHMGNCKSLAISRIIITASRCEKGGPCEFLSFNLRLMNTSNHNPYNRFSSITSLDGIRLQNDKYSISLVIISSKSTYENHFKKEFHIKI